MRGTDKPGDADVSPGDPQSRNTRKIRVLPLESADTEKVAVPSGVVEGEGSREADRRYRDAASRFAHEGPVAQAADDARAAIDDPTEGAELRAAADAGKARVAERDPDEGPYPVFWSDDHASAWARIRDAIAKDWLQTRFDLGLKGGVDLGQDVGDTIGEAISAAEPERRALSWEEAQPAVRLGHGASRHFAARSWDSPLQGLLRAEWERMDTGVSWGDARSFVHDGWRLGRLDETVKFPRERS